MMSFPDRESFENNRRQNVQYATSEVQTDLDTSVKPMANTKVYKEIRIQTDPVQVKDMSTIVLDDGKSELSAA